MRQRRWRCQLHRIRHVSESPPRAEHEPGASQTVSWVVADSNCTAALETIQELAEVWRPQSCGHSWRGPDGAMEGGGIVVMKLDSHTHSYVGLARRFGGSAI